MTSSKLYVYTIEKVCEFANDALEIRYSLTRKEAIQNLQLSDSIWDKKQHLIVADKSAKRLIVFDLTADGLTEKESKELEFEPLALLLTQNQLIVSLSDGNVRWYEYSTDEEQKIGKEPQLQIMVEYGPLQYMVYNNPMTKIVGTTSKGTIVMIPSEAPSEEEEEEQGEVPQASEGGPAKAKEKPKCYLQNLEISSHLK